MSRLFSAKARDSAAKAQTFPMHVAIDGVEGAPHPTWDVEVSHDQFMAPMFAAGTAGAVAMMMLGRNRRASARPSG